MIFEKHCALAVRLRSMQDAEQMAKYVSMAMGAAVENADILKPSNALVNVGSLNPVKNALHVPKSVSARKPESQYVELMVRITQIRALRSVLGSRPTAQESVHVRSHASALRNSNQYVDLMVKITKIRALRSVLG